ncbi:MAG: cytotoxic translational repressor of toxin-antitoxin stability system [Jatrophihabitantaceae bacterium]
MTFELNLPDGWTLRTRVSHPVDRTDYGKSMWSHILRDQLAVDEDTFWACVNNGRPPDRGGGPVKPAESIPAGVVAILLREVGLPEAEVAAMTRDQAIARVNEYWTGGA